MLIVWRAGVDQGISEPLNAWCGDETSAWWYDVG